jgi:hypothetical protein
MRLVSDLIVGLLDTEEGCEVTIERGSDPLAAAAVGDADVLITTTGVAPPAAVAALLEARPRLRAIAVEGDAEEGVVYELCPQREELQPLSPSTLLAAVFRRQEPWFA